MHELGAFEQGAGQGEEELGSSEEQHKMQQCWLGVGRSHVVAPASLPPLPLPERSIQVNCLLPGAINSECCWPRRWG